MEINQQSHLAPAYLSFNVSSLLVKHGTWKALSFWEPQMNLCIFYSIFICLTFTAIKMVNSDITMPSCHWFICKDFLIWMNFKVFIEFITIFLLLNVLGFWLKSLSDLSSPNRDWTHNPWSGKWSLNHWTTKEVLCH